MDNECWNVGKYSTIMIILFRNINIFSNGIFLYGINKYFLNKFFIHRVHVPGPVKKKTMDARRMIDWVIHFLWPATTPDAWRFVNGEWPSWRASRWGAPK